MKDHVLFLLITLIFNYEKPSPACHLTITLTSCQWKDHALSDKEKMACGQWMSSEHGNNRERFVFSHNHGFKDLLFSLSNFDDPRNGVWQITSDQLDLRYKIRLLIIPIHYTVNYHIITLNDSVMVIASKATRRFASRIISLKKMKLNGKFIRG